MGRRRGLCGESERACAQVPGRSGDGYKEDMRCGVGSFRDMRLLIKGWGIFG